MAKYNPDTSHWDADTDTDDDGGGGDPPVQVTRHTVAIDDNRGATGYEYGVEWLFSVENGTVVGWYRGHYLEGRTQSDPMSSPAWHDIPAPVRGALRQELGGEAGTVDVDPPEHYGGDDS